MTAAPAGDSRRRLLFVVGGALVGVALAVAAVLVLRDDSDGATTAATGVGSSETVASTVATTEESGDSADATTAPPPASTAPPATTVAPPTAPPATAPPLLKVFEGRTLEGQACRAVVATGDTCPPSQRGSWAFRLTFTVMAADGASALGEIEWLELGARHRVSVKTDGTLVHFEEVEAIVAGDALLGCVYDIPLAGGSGWWSCPDGSNGPFTMG